MHEQSSAILHIGSPKTGTTSIQAFLAQNVDRLEAMGIKYPSFLGRRNHVQLAAYAVGKGHVDKAGIVGVRTLEEWLDWKPRFRNQFVEGTTDPGRWIITSEHMSSRLLNADSVEELRDLITKTIADIQILLYVRRQDEMAVSSYSTWVRDGISRPFDLDGVLGDSNRYDFRRIVARWQEVFGEPAVSVRLYPRAGSGQNLLDDFAHAVGLGNIDDWPRPKRLNPSLSATELEFLRRFNALVPRLDSKRHRVRGVGNLVGLVEGTLGGPPFRLSPEDSRQVMERYAESNAWILNRVDTPDPDPSYFSAMVPEYDDAVTRPDLTVDDAISIASKIWDSLEAERTALRNYKNRQPE